MNEKNINARHASVSNLIDAGQYFDAINILSQSDLKGKNLSDFSNVRDTYKYMLTFFAQSTAESSDPTRESMYNDLGEKLHRINDLLLLEALKPASSKEFFSKLRTYSIPSISPLGKDLADAAGIALKVQFADETDQYPINLHRELELAGDRLFNRLRTKMHISPEEKKAILGIIEDEETDDSLFLIQSMIIAGLFLGCLEYYDREKFEILLQSALKSHDNRISSRALTLVLLLIIRYSKRIGNDKAINETLRQLKELEGFDIVLKSFVFSMLRTIDTDRINRKMKDELMPEILKLKPDIEKHLRGLGENIDIADLEANPDWEELIDKSGIADKLKSFTEMQLEGGDIFMSAFSQMKSFAFFRDTSNWFLPFFSSHTALATLAERVPSSVTSVLMKGPHFCASDKYSMALALSRMPKLQLDLMSSQMENQINALEEERNTTLAETTKLPMEVEMSLFLKDLFRFFRLSPIKDEIPAIFDNGFAIPHCEPFLSLFNDEEFLRSMAEFYFKYAYWKEAAELYEYVINLLPEAQEEIYQKLGYCYQELGEYVKAEEMYHRAESLNNESLWLIRHLGAVHRLQGKFKEAIQYYKKAAELQPDNRSIEMSLARLYVEQGDIDKALKIYYKWAYMQEKPSAKIDRAIAWCEFLNGNFAKSSSRYENLGEDRNPTDYLNHGHALFAQKEVAAALDKYRAFMLKSGKSATELSNTFAADIPDLIKAGVSRMDINLMLDALHQ